MFSGTGGRIRDNQVSLYNITIEWCTIIAQ